MLLFKKYHSTKVVLGNLPYFGLSFLSKEEIIISKSQFYANKKCSLTDYQKLAWSNEQYIDSNKLKIHTTTNK